MLSGRSHQEDDRGGGDLSVRAWWTDCWDWHTRSEKCRSPKGSKLEESKKYEYGTINVNTVDIVDCGRAKWMYITVPFPSKGKSLLPLTY